MPGPRCPRHPGSTDPPLLIPAHSSLTPQPAPAMTGKATLEAPDCGPEETASESANVPATEPSGEVAAPKSTGEEQTPKPQEPAPHVPAPDAPAASKPAPPSEGDKRGDRWRRVAGMAGSGGWRAFGHEPLPLPLLLPQMSPVPRCCWPWRTWVIAR